MSDVPTTRKVLPGTRVIALQNMDKDCAWIFGEGVYLGELQPDLNWVPAGWTNPCIQLDNGLHVWGFECWWGEVENMKARIGERHLVEVALLEPVNPKKETS